MGRKSRNKSSLQKDENQTYKNDEQFYKKLIIVRDKFILFYNEEIEKNIPEDERICIQELHKEWTNLNQFYNIHELFKLKIYHTQLNYRLTDISNEKYMDYITSCMRLRVENMYKLIQ